MSGFGQGVAVVIGGSGGLGQAICLELARQGCNVALSYRNNVQAAQAVVASLQALGVQAHAFALQLSEREQVAAA